MPVTIGVFIGPGSNDGHFVTGGDGGRGRQYDTPNDQFGKFLLDEFIPSEITKKYDIVTDPDGWAIAGHSSGGNASLSAVWFYPDRIRKALTASGETRVVGICDSPPALGRKIAAQLRVPESALRLDYLGLNHLGWVRAVWTDGADRLPEILSSDDAIRAIYGRPLFEPGEVRRLGLLPNEYLQYYYHHDEVVGRLRATPRTRAEDVADVAARLKTSALEAVTRGEDPLPVYEAAIFARRSSYMATETDQRRDLAMMGGHVEGGYARAALDVIEAMLHPQSRELIVNTVNQGAIADLDDADVVEVPSRVGPDGAHPRSMGGLPVAVRDLVLRVKAYERATVAAALHRSWREAVAALALHPLVPSSEIGERIAGEYRRRHGPSLGYLD